MKITCDKNKLIECLNIVGRTVPVRTTLPILECVLLTADDTGLRLAASDLEMNVQTAPFQCEIDEPGCAALDAKLFSEIVRKMPGDYIDIEVGPNNMAKCESGRAMFNISGQPGDEFPVMPSVEKTSGISLKSKTFKEMIRQTIFSVATEDV
ncbi:MAG: DNA polymerase III subunit beta, partial [Defluviitaleaceae bacterium]|nr:DNA polymerase III subunit beta [Defluviitaleaceae bacterium]